MGGRFQSLNEMVDPVFLTFQSL